MSTRVFGAVLTGGASTRMGADKALLEVDGLAMAARVAEALTAGGADEVRCIGGDLDALSRLGLTATADVYPGEGPFGAVVTALGLAAELEAELLMVAACDHPDLDGVTIRSLLSALTDASSNVGYVVAVDQHDDPQLLLALRREVVGPAAVSAFQAGVRSMQGFYRQLQGVRVSDLSPASLRDVDRPSDLPGG